MAASVTEHILTLHLETMGSIRNFEIGSHHFTFNNPFEPVVNFGRYTDARPFRFNLHIDYALDSWGVFKDGTLISQGAFGNSGQVSSIRFNYAGADIDTGGVAIDNLLIAVPEPNLPMSCALLAVAIALRRIGRPARVARTPVAGGPMGPHGSS